VRQVAEQCFMPFTVGGGIRTIDDVTRLIQAGAEKVSINTAAVTHPDIVDQTARRFGRCATVVNLDPKRVPAEAFRERTGRVPEHVNDAGQVFEIHTHGGRTPTGLEALPWARQVVRRGAGEIVLTSMDADGTKDGYDLEITRLIVEAVDVPVVASGGCGNPGHMIDVLKPLDQGGAGASAALAASIFHYAEYTIAQTKTTLHEAGIPVRLGSAIPKPDPHPAC